MRIESITHRNALDMLGSEATDAEAEAFIELLKESEFNDTDDIHFDTWRSLIDKAIARAEKDQA